MNNLKQKYIEVVKEIAMECRIILDYSKTYREQTDWVSEMYDGNMKKMELNNDSIFIDFEVDNEETDGKYYYALSLFQIEEIVKIPNLGFEIFKSKSRL